MNSKSVRSHTGAYTSPGTPDYGEEIPKSWSSERIPLPSNSSRHASISAAALMPFNSGRALPSKWDDAERWITSPISSCGPVRNSAGQPQRQPKSKSGPLGSPGVVLYPPNEGGGGGNFMEKSPLNTGVLVPDGLSINYDAVIAAKSSLIDEGNIGVPDSVSHQRSKDRVNGVKEEKTRESWRDMATQMRPDGSTHSSSKGRVSSSNLPSSSLRQSSNRAGKDEVRDVQVDKQGLRMTKDTSSNTDLPWNAPEASKNTTKFQEQEGKITAWENLQKAKAEAAIQKLEMKLEKKRSTSMDKIANKLRASQMKAEAMRNRLSTNQSSPSGLSGCIYVKPYFQSKCLVCRKK